MERPFGRGACQFVSICQANSGHLRSSTAPRKTGIETGSGTNTQRTRRRICHDLSKAFQGLFYELLLLSLIGQARQDDSTRMEANIPQTTHRCSGAWHFLRHVQGICLSGATRIWESAMGPSSFTSSFHCHRVGTVLHEHEQKQEKHIMQHEFSELQDPQNNSLLDSLNAERHIQLYYTQTWQASSLGRYYYAFAHFRACLSVLHLP